MAKQVFVLMDSGIVFDLLYAILRQDYQKLPFVLVNCGTFSDCSIAK